MPELIAFSGFVTVENKLYSFGGHHTKLNGPGPTMYAYTNRIYYLDFSDLEVNELYLVGWKNIAKLSCVFV